MTEIEKEVKKIAKKNAKSYKVYCDWADRDPVCEFFSSKDECEKSAMEAAKKVMDKAEKLIYEMFENMFTGDTPEILAKEFKNKLEN